MIISIFNDETIYNISKDTYYDGIEPRLKQSIDIHYGGTVSSSNGRKKYKKFEKIPIMMHVNKKLKI